MNIKRLVFSIVLSVLMAALLVNPVFADGQYGQYGVVTEKPSEKPKEEVVHETVEADLGDNLFLVAMALMGMAGMFTVLSKVSAKYFIFE